MTSSPVLAPVPSGAGIASMTQLPPSPDLKAAAVSLQQSILPEFSLDGGAGSTGPVAEVTPTRRLRSVARYQAFHPQALACSTVLTSSLSDEESSPLSTQPKNPQTSTVHALKDPGPSSLGAVAGPQGVALFRLSRPHVPLIILSHATIASAGLAISSLAFQPPPTTAPRSLLLAASRGSGVLVWDASGHSPTPLMGRLGVDGAPAGDLDTFTSIAWKPSTIVPLLAATTFTSVSLWDLRIASQGSTCMASATNATTFKPSLRFGSARKSHSSNASFVQVACSAHTDECATIDSSGTVRVYDIRMTERTRTSKGSALAMFSAHDTAGIGIAYFGCQSKDNNSASPSWLTWGLDSNASSAVVKIWSSNQQQEHEKVTASTDDYWYMDGGSPGERSPRPVGKSSASEAGDYHLVAKCSRPNLACARVCASPVERSFMAVGHVVPSVVNNDFESGGWWAELYKLSIDDQSQQPQSDTDGTLGVEKLVSFQGGSMSSDKPLTSVLGNRSDWGELQGAELAFSSASSLSKPRAISTSCDEGATEEKEDEKQELNLLLCCLSDTGIVTTHVVPEALPKITTFRSSESGKRSDHSPMRPVIRTATVRTAFTTGSQARVYPEDKEGSSLADAASFWSGSGIPVSTAASNVDIISRGAGDEARASAEQPSSPHKSSSDVSDSLTAKRRNVEEGMMPFDMDIPVAYGSVTAGNIAGVQIGVTDMSSGNVVTAAGMGVVEEGEQVSVDVRDSNAMMENIETERVPCPRLCGATFGSGNGGLAIFHNGDVKKMWFWYQRADTIRGAPGTKGEASFSDTDSIRAMPTTSGMRTSHPLSPEVEGSSNQKQAISRSGPRTLKELMIMTATAKKVQWGERNGSDGSESEEVLSAVDNFFEEDSLDESNSSDSGEDGPTSPPQASEMYNRYFGAQAWKSNGEKLDLQVSPSHRQSIEHEASSSKMRTFVGASSDMLAPVVRVTHDCDAIMLNHQSVHLAEGWELGGWDFRTVGAGEDFKIDSHCSRGSLEPEKECCSGLEFAKPVSPPRRTLARHRFLVPPSSKHSALTRTLSDPNLAKASRQTSKSLNFQHDEPGVHGGEYSVRPNMEESMTFLRKLFTHQQEGGATLPALLSPPDSPLLPSSLSGAVSKRPSSTGQMFPYAAVERAVHGDQQTRREVESNANELPQLGIYTLGHHNIDEDLSVVEELEDIKRICLHNATICESFRETEKEGVWNLLAQTVDSQLSQHGKAFDGWGGKGGGALGVDLVSNLLRYYESLGDVQMLATIFCVLSGHSRSRRGAGRTLLLPQCQDEKYDAYIRRYAELLYGWGLLSVRAELNKHLLRIPPTREGDVTLEETAEAGRAPGIAVVFVCPRCGRDADFNTNMCRTCHDFAFRCSICDNAVRGLFTVCDLCNHGGHVEHIKAWFAKNSACATGCGCNCTFSPLIPPQADLGA